MSSDESAGRGRVWRLALAGALALAVLAPLPIVRAAALGLALVAWVRGRTSWAFSADAAALWGVALVASALAVPVGTLDAPPLARAQGVVLLAAAALAWARVAARAGDVPLGAEAPLWPEALAILGVLLLSAGPLASSIGFGGDEDFHFQRLQHAISVWDPRRQPTLLVALGASALTAPLLALATRRLETRRRLLLVPGGAALVGVAAGLGVTASRLDPGQVSSFLRYPDLEVWPQALVSLAPTTAACAELWYHPGWSRLLPLLTTLALAWAVARFVPLPPAGRLLAALAFATIPSVRYYATLLYLEVPFVAAMLVTLLGLGRERPRDGLPRGLPLLALMAVPFSKETALPFFGLVGLHAAWSAWGGREPGRIPLAALGGVALFFALPLAAGSVFRNEVRSYSPDRALLVDPGTYATFARAALEQFGALPLLALAGVALAWRRGRADHALLCLAIAGGYTVAMALDGDWCLFISRFMLVLLPPLLALAYEVLASEPFRRARVWAPVLGAILGANLLASPVGLRGERVPFRGCYTQSMQELIYPWDEVFGMLKAGSAPSTITVVGLDYTYPFWFDALKHGATWELRTLPYPESIVQEAFRRARIEHRTGLDALPPLERLRADLKKALASGPGAVVVALPPGDLVSGWDERVGGYARTEVRQGSCRLLVYVRAGAP